MDSSKVTPAKTKIEYFNNKYHVILPNGTIYSSHKNPKDAAIQERILRRLNELTFRFVKLLFSVKKMDINSTNLEVKEEVLKSQIFIDEIDGKIEENFTLKSPNSIDSRNFLSDCNKL